MEKEKKLKEQELTFKFQMLEQQIMAIQQQLQAVEQTLIDMASLNLGLDEIKKDKEILSPVGAGIFAKAKLISEELVVAIGEKNYVKKSIPETKKLIQEQISKLEKVKESLDSELEKINEEITKTMIEYQGKS
ncbi:MAG: prefoldin subunit alpha [Candidatus Daviesbacteria bacterium]|nr:prefoldin subunit alpha [Candidatus Daviesbacteria bacterium]